jgi:hypothetical protein
MIMQRGEHLTIEGIQKIVNIRASLNLNKGLTTVLKTAFPNSIPFSILPVQHSTAQHSTPPHHLIILNYILNG